MRTLLLLLALSVMAALAGCGAAPSASAQTAVETNKVELPPSYRFDPAVIKVKAGTTVTWHNSDNFTHSVQVLKEGFQMVNLPPGTAGTITFAQPGEYDYVCTYHTQQMKGKVIVTS
jgi:plastocyanin